MSKNQKTAIMYATLLAFVGSQEIKKKGITEPEFVSTNAQRLEKLKPIEAKPKRAGFLNNHKAVMQNGLHPSQGKSQHRLNHR